MAVLSNALQGVTVRKKSGSCFLSFARETSKRSGFFESQKWQRCNMAFSCIVEGECQVLDTEKVAVGNADLALKLDTCPWRLMPTSNGGGVQLEPFLLETQFIENVNHDSQPNLF